MPKSHKASYLLFALPASIALAVGLGANEGVQAKLGESYQSYKTKVVQSWTPAAEDTNAKSSNYRFTLKVAPEQENASSGYAAGLTITVVNGKITGQSMAIRTGSNQMVGAAMATAHGFAFAYESIGKIMPKEKAKTEAEFKAFSEAVGQAFMGKPQNIRYPGFNSLITVARDNMGNLIIAATPATPIGQPSSPDKSTASGSVNKSGSTK